MSPSTIHPFNDPTADIIIRSADNVIFRLHRIILSLASDFFRDMLSLPQPTALSTTQTFSNNPPTGPHEDGLPMIDVSEPGDVLERIFRLCYPIDDPPLETITDVHTTLEAAMKYQMAEAVKITKGRLLALVSTDSLRVYAVACRLNLEDEASAAAKEVFKQKAQDRYVEDLEEIPIGAYYRLLSFCERQGRVRDRFTFTVHRTGTRAHSATATLSVDEAIREMTSMSLGPKIAPPPFDAPEAEVHLVSSDDVEFHVYKQILRLSSPILYATFTSHNPPSPIRVSEPSRIFSILLQLCYPGQEPAMDDIHGISAALAAADKYQMQRASQVLRNAMMSRKDSSDEDPVLLYATACRFGMRDLAFAAAKRTLRTDVMGSSISELESIGVSGACLYRLLEYHRQCRAAVRSIFDGTDWIDSDMLIQLHDSCRRGYRRPGQNKPCWYARYMTEIANEPWPRSESVTQDSFLEKVFETTRDESHSCSSCVDVPGIFLLMRFSKYVAGTIESLEKRVPLEWPPASTQ